MTLDDINEVEAPNQSKLATTSIQQPMPQQNVQQSLVGKLANSGGVNTILGAGDALPQTVTGALNLIPGVNIPQYKSGSGTGYTVGNVLGNIGTFVGGGELVDTARAASEAIPYAGKVASYLGQQNWLPTALRQGIGSAGYGAITNPQDAGQGAAHGAELSAGLSLLPGIGQASQYFRPQQYTNELLNNLGGGKTIEENGQNFATMLQNSFKQKEGESDALYNPIHSSVGNNPIYDGALTKDANPNSQYLSLNKSVLNSYGPDVNDLHDTFIQNPTFDNAHNLQSQLGTEIRAIDPSNSAADRNAVQNLTKARNSLRGDMDSFLQSSNPPGFTGPGLAEQYKAAANHYYNSVSPYLGSSKIADIAQGNETNPQNIANLFKFPGDNETQIVNDMGDAGKNALIYSQLGKSTASRTPDKLLGTFNDLKQNSGLGSYVTPDLENQMGTLGTKIKATKGLQAAAGVGLGASLLHPLGGVPWIPEASAAAGGLMGGVISPFLMGKLQNNLPIGAIGNTLKATAQGAYPAARAGLISNLIPNKQSNQNAGGQQ